MDIQPVKTLEKVLKPVVAPFIGHILKGLAIVGKLPAIAIAKTQNYLKGILKTKEHSLKNYVLIGSYYISKRLILFVVLAILVLIYFVFINPPAIVNKWLHRVPVLQENTSKLSAFSGSAKVVSADANTKARYVGDVVDGLYAGKGKLYNAAGNLVYEGDFDKGQKSGNGTLYDDQGSMLYKGAFAGDTFNGAGTLYTDKQKVLYIGEFQNGKYGGAGKLFADNGDIVYDGAFNAGLYNGAGKLFSPGGAVLYEGEFAAGEYSGAGKLFDAAGKLIYEGGFKNGLYSGEGTEYYATGLMKYKGQFLNGAYAGEGAAFDEKGVQRFKGTFQSGALSGLGEAYDEAGKLVYQGQFKAGAYDGIGTLFDADGAPLLKSFFAGGQISLQSFLGLPSKKVEDLLGKPAEVTLQDASVTLAGEEAAVADASLSSGGAGEAAAGDVSGSSAAAGEAGASAAVQADAGQAAGAAAASTDPAADSAGAGAASSAGLKLLMSYPDYQLSLLVEPSKDNPKEAVVTSLAIWGSKPLAVLQPVIETVVKRDEPNDAGYRVVDLEASAGIGTYMNSYAKDDFLFTLTHFKDSKAAHLLQVSSLK
ncbi:MORN repeat-containing protein [Paenibacillus hexagrammi]|uniref:Antitoxin component YwqK of YwqJK toxin-antitoxin module n=1 Tax=Paenibacillus hexagrammi TaxID=2908839 RepID=A0ABY3SK60_9BACL|nr:hypothetical protein [Paenibacillus sp. YPD9-1]UJF34099.1 hypothetical protein L0M14_02350 [Paenibacillus sp. YPD9-1]